MPPEQFLRSPLSSSLAKKAMTFDTLHHLIQIAAIEEVPEDEEGSGVYFTFFMVPEKNGDWRWILDLKFLNLFIRLRWFQMETLKTITESLQEGEFMMYLDLTEASLHVPIPPSHRRFLRFCLGNQHWQFRALPF